MENVAHEIGGEVFPVSKGDWYCMGVWFAKLKGAPGWWTLTNQRCLVRLETVLNADVNIMEESESNPLPKRLSKDAREKADEGTWKVSDVDHIWIKTETQRRSSMEYDSKLAAVFNEDIGGETTWATNSSDEDTDTDNEHDE